MRVRINNIFESSNINSLDKYKKELEANANNNKKFKLPLINNRASNDDWEDNIKQLYRLIRDNNKLLFCLSNNNISFIDFKSSLMSFIQQHYRNFLISKLNSEKGFNKDRDMKVNVEILDINIDGFSISLYDENNSIKDSIKEDDILK